MKCVEDEINTLDVSNCLQKCSGLQITSFENENIVKNKELFTKLDSFHSMLMENLKGLNVYALPDQLTSLSKLHL